MSLTELNQKTERILSEIQSQRNAGTDWDCEELHAQLAVVQKEKLELLKPIAQSLVKDVASCIELYIVGGKHWEEFPHLKNAKDISDYICGESSLDYVMKVVWADMPKLRDWMRITIEMDYPRKLGAPHLDIGSCLNLFEKDEDGKGQTVSFSNSDHRSSAPSYLYFLGNYQGVWCHLHFSYPEKSQISENLPSSYDLTGTCNQPAPKLKV